VQFYPLTRSSNNGASAYVVSSGDVATISLPSAPPSYASAAATPPPVLLSRNKSHEPSPASSFSTDSLPPLVDAALLSASPHKGKRKYSKAPRPSTWQAIRSFPKEVLGWVERSDAWLWCFSTAKSVHKRFKDLSVESQEQLLFGTATLLGTATFLVLFECLYRINSYNLERAETVFSVSYASAYLLSIIWQHSLNRWCVSSFSATPYWASLCQTYLVYSMSLTLMSFAGAVLVSSLSLSPRLVTLFTLPTSGVLNYYLLRWALHEHKDYCSL